VHPTEWKLCRKIIRIYCIHTHVKYLFNIASFDCYNNGDLAFGTCLVFVIAKDKSCLVSARAFRTGLTYLSLRDIARTVKPIVRETENPFIKSAESPPETLRKGIRTAITCARRCGNGFRSWRTTDDFSGTSVRAFVSPTGTENRRRVTVLADVSFPSAGNDSAVRGTVALGYTRFEERLVPRAPGRGLQNRVCRETTFRFETSESSR